MATIVLSAVGNALLPGLGGYLGAAAGAYLDQNVLFPPPDVKGPKLDSLQLGSASEGSPVNYCLGKENRCPGTVIWVTEPRARKKTSGGKGGPSVTTYTYTVDVAIAFCEGPINRIPRLWANGKLLYNASPDVDVVSNNLSAARIEERRYFAGTETFLSEFFLEITSPNGGPNLGLFRAGRDVVVSGWSTTGNNGTFRCVSASKDATTGISKLKLRNVNATNDAGGETVTLHQTLPNFNPKKASGFTFYTGTSTQLADPLIQSYDGAADTPAYRDIVYVVIEGLQLSEFGNQVPQIQAQIEEVATDKNLSDAIAQIMRRGGRTDEEINVSEVTGTLRGYLIRGPQPIEQQLLRLLRTFDVLRQEDQGVMRFFMRTNPAIRDIDAGDLAAHEEGSDAPRPVKFLDTSPADLPARVELKYTEPRNDYQDGSTIERRVRVVNDNLSSVDAQGIILSGSQAKGIARRILWTAWANYRRAYFFLPFSYVELIEGDIARITAKGQTTSVLITRVARGVNGLLEFEGLSEQTNTLSITNVTAEDPRAPNNELYVPPEMRLSLLDIAPLQDAQLYTPGYYVAACSYDTNALFTGAGLYRSVDDGSTYELVIDLLSETTMGVTSGTLGTAVTGYWDNKNTITVVLSEGELSNATALQVYGGTNWCMIGKEILAFKNATLTAANTYQLSGFLRGLRNTEDQVAGHTSNEPFVLLSNTNMWFVEMPHSQVNISQQWKAIPYGGALADYDSQAGVMRANNLRPFSPCKVQGSRDPSTNDLSVTFERRTRAIVRVLGGFAVPLAEETEHYEVDILNVAETQVLDTLTVTNPRSFTYTAAQQTGVGLTPGNAVHFRIYQMSATYGRGKSTLKVI